LVDAFEAEIHLRAQYLFHIVDTAIQTGADIANADVVERRSCADRKHGDGSRDDLSVRRGLQVPLQ